MFTQDIIENYPIIRQAISVNPADDHHVPSVVLRLGGSVIGTLGNFSLSTGRSGSRKTFNACAIAASALSGKPLLGYDSSFPVGKKRILYFDTEQSHYHCHKILQRIIRLSGMEPAQASDLIEILMLREYHPVDRRIIIEQALADGSDIGLVIIDGLRDLFFDINSPDDIAEVVGLLIKWSCTFFYHIHIILHLNRGEEEIVRQLGAGLSLKAETVLRLVRNENDDAVSEVHPYRMRDKEFVPFAFRVNEEGLPVLAEDVNLRQRSSNRSIDYRFMAEDVHRQALDAAFGDSSAPLSYTPLLERLGKGYASIGFRRSRNVHVNLLKFLLEHDIVRKVDRGYVYNRAFHYTPSNYPMKAV